MERKCLMYIFSTWSLFLGLKNKGESISNEDKGALDTWEF